VRRDGLSRNCDDSRHGERSPHLEARASWAQLPARQGNLVVGVGARWGFAFDVCVAPRCANNVKDADETGKDCDGADCGPICPQ
jgi:hypothetical protein